MNDLALAYRLAEKAHQGQLDKIGMPYFYHVRAVSEIVQIFPSYLNLNSEKRNDVIIAAVLHDIVEDTLYSLEDLTQAGFNEQVTEIVNLLTFDKTYTRLNYYQKIVTNPLARIVKTADLAHNNLYSRRHMLDSETQARLEKKYAQAIDVVVSDYDIDMFNLLINKK